MIRRRQFLSYSGLAVAAGFLPLTTRQARAAMDALAEQAIKAGQNEVIVQIGGGAYEKRVRKYFFDPFTAETGIRVISAGGEGGLARIKAMTQVGNVEWDFVTLPMGDLTAENQSMFRDLGKDCEELPNIDKNGVNGACQQYGVMFDIGTQPLAYDKSAFPNATREPSSWADFWDVNTFPGPRSLPNIGQPEHTLIAALLADGVAVDDLFPLDLDRAFRKLDEIRPHVTVWWTSGDQSVQMFRNKEVVMAQIYSNRAGSLQAEGLPIGVSQNGAVLDAYIGTILAQAPRPLAALALLNFIYTRPDVHAAYATEVGFATGVKDVAKYMKAENAAQLPTSETVWPQIVKMDVTWLGKHRGAMNQRWTEWLSQ